MKLSSLTLEGNLLLAPMAGVTDMAFRRLCRRFGAAMVTSEMVSAKALCYQDRKTRLLLPLSEEEQPAAIQLFGSDPEACAEAARRCMEYSPDAIDLNMGCPTPKIVNNGDGCALMKDIPKMAAITEAVVKAVPVPVSVKMRLGWDESSVNAPEAARAVEAAGAAWVTVHGRTRSQFYAPSADWEGIARVKTAVSIPVIGNGDVFSPEDARRMLDETGCDGVMIGRGCLGNPWIFRDTLHYLKTGELLPPPPLTERVAVAREHIGALVELKGERVGCLEARKHLAWYLKGLRDASRLKQAAGSVTSMTEVDALLSAILSRQEEASK